MVIQYVTSVKLELRDTCCVLQCESRVKRDGVSQYKCGVCSTEFMSLLCRDRHLRTHSLADTARDIVVCKLCSKTCDRRSYLTTHLLSHPLIYFCSVCSVFFPSSLQLISHLNIHSSLPSPSSTDLFWQSIAVSVFLPNSNSWLSGICEDQVNRLHGSSLDNILQDVDCSSVSFSCSDTEMFVSSGLVCGQDIVEQTQVDDTEVDVLVDITCIDRNICLKVGYKPMNTDVFSHLQQTFGCCECEQCGQLFSVQSDLDTHVNAHTGLWFISISLLYKSTFTLLYISKCMDK